MISDDICPSLPNCEKYRSSRLNLNAKVLFNQLLGENMDISVVQTASHKLDDQFRNFTFLVALSRCIAYFYKSDELLFKIKFRVLTLLELAPKSCFVEVSEYNPFHHLLQESRCNPDRDIFQALLAKAPSCCLRVCPSWGKVYAIHLMILSADPDFEAIQEMLKHVPQCARLATESAKLPIHMLLSSTVYEPLVGKQYTRYVSLLRQLLQLYPQSAFQEITETVSKLSVTMITSRASDSSTATRNGNADVTEPMLETSEDGTTLRYRPPTDTTSPRTHHHQGTLSITSVSQVSSLDAIAPNHAQAHTVSATNTATATTAATVFAAAAVTAATRPVSVTADDVSPAWSVDSVNNIISMATAVEKTTVTWTPLSRMQEHADVRVRHVAESFLLNMAHKRHRGYGSLNE